MHQVRLDIGFAALPGFEILGSGTHEKRPAPERTQVKIELALVIDEQRTAAFALQD